MTCSTSNMKAVFQSVNIDFEISFRLCICLSLCILYNIWLESYTNDISMCRTNRFYFAWKIHSYTWQNKLRIKWIPRNSTQRSLLSILTNIAIFLAKDAKINLLHKQWEFIACNLSLHYGIAWEKPWVLFYEGGACFIMHKIVV